jgi:hypothetical protein
MSPVYFVFAGLAVYLLASKPQAVNVMVRAPVGSSSNVSSSEGKTPSDIAILDTPHAELIQSMQPRPTPTPGPAPATVPYAAPPTPSTLAPRPGVPAPAVTSAPAPSISSRATIQAPVRPVYTERPWNPPAPRPMADFGNMSNLDDRDAYAQYLSRLNSSVVVAPESPGGA